MENTPYIETKSGKNGTKAFFALRMMSINTRTDQRDAFYRELLNQQTDFIAALFGLGENAAIELRYVCNPYEKNPHRGAIDLVLRVCLETEADSEAHVSAQGLYRELLPNVLSISTNYQWEAVTSEEQYQKYFCEKSDWNVRELVRREKQILLNQPSYTAPQSPIGFQRDDKRADPKNGEDTAYLCFPYIRNYDTLEGLFYELLYQRETTIISICLRPTRATKSEYKFLLDELQQAERFVQLPLDGGVSDPSYFFPSLQRQSVAVCEQLRQWLDAMRDDTFFTTVHLFSRQPVPKMLCESIGVAFTEHVHSFDPNADGSSGKHSPMFGGGFDWIDPATENGRKKVLRNLRSMDDTTITDGLLGKKKLRLRRLFDINQANCVFRLPLPVEGDFPGLATQRTVQLPAPVTEGVVQIGQNQYQSYTEKVYFKDIDRLRHTYILGKTGTGKSTLLKSLIMQDILAGNGVGVLDPHGELVEALMQLIPPERAKDVVLVDPERDDRFVGLNLLDVKSELEKDSLVNYLLEVFKSIFGENSEAFGPMFEMYYRNAMLLVMADESNTPTLMDLHRIFSDSKYRRMKVRACKDPHVLNFWKMALNAGGDAALENVAPYITSKLVRITHSHVMRMICCQKQSTINFGDVIEGRRILLVNLSKGGLGDTTSYFLGMMLVKLLQTVAFRRDTSNHGKPPIPFYLYVDEFHNLATPTFANLLSESRKYGLAVTMANQYMGQLPMNIKDSIIGNIGSKISFRLGSDDAKAMEKSFSPYVHLQDFINLPNFNAYASMLVDGNVRRPFNLRMDRTEYPEHSESYDAIISGMENYTRSGREIEALLVRDLIDSEQNDAESVSPVGA